MAKLEYRIVNTVARSVFSERFPTEEAAQARIDEYADYGEETGHPNFVKYLEIFVTTDTPRPYMGLDAHRNAVKQAKVRMVEEL